MERALVKIPAQRVIFLLMNMPEMDAFPCRGRSGSWRYGSTPDPDAHHRDEGRTVGKREGARGIRLDCQTLRAGQASRGDTETIVRGGQNWNGFEIKPLRAQGI